LTSWSDILVGIRASLTKHFWLCEGFCAPVYAFLYRRQLSCFEDSPNAKHKRVHGIAGLDAARSGIGMPNIVIDEFLLMIIIAGIGLAVAYLRAEYVVHRRFKAAEHAKLNVQRDLHAAPGTGESGARDSGQVVLINVEVIVADPPLARIEALRRQIRDRGLQHELTGALAGRIVHRRP
jgi:hypothetical protein